MGNCFGSLEAEPATPPPRVGQVENLMAMQDAECAAITLQWDPPLLNEERVTGYDIRFKPVSADHYTFRTASTDVLSITLRPNDGVVPLCQCNFEVRARIHEVVGEWRRLIEYVEWVCCLPGCTQRRIWSSHRHIYEFCSRDHAKEFGLEYCLFPECQRKKSRVDGLVYHYCSDHHLRLAKIRMVSTLLEINGQNDEFEQQCKQFSKKWSKGSSPPIQSVLKIINPAVEDRFNHYVQELPQKHRKIEQYYHGTTLACDIVRYLLVCSGSTQTHGMQQCGLCSIVVNGFEQRRISSGRQRFGPGFYLASTSSKAVDYCQGNHGTQAMLLCDVAPGKKYELRQNNTGLTAPPDGYHSVHGRCKFLGQFGDLNYDEIVLHNEMAIHPRYVIIFRR